MIPVITGHRPSSVGSVPLANEPHHDNLLHVPLESSSCARNKSRRFTLGLLNARSAKQQDSSADTPAEIHDLIVDNKVDLLLVTETWFREGDYDRLAIGDMTPSGYSLQHLPRPPKRGGGIALLHRSSLKVGSLTCVSCPSFEGFTTTLSSGCDSVTIIAVYRPPSSSINVFMDEFSNLLTSAIATHKNIMVAGDFNIHVDRTNDISAIKFLSIVHDANFIQHVNEPTHVNGRTLDLVLSASYEQLGISILGTNRSVSSDHFAVLLQMQCTRPPRERKTLSVRK